MQANPWLLCSTIGFQDLSPALQAEVQELQRRMAIELKPLVLESSLMMQKILEAENHKARCRLLKYFIDAERSRLNTKKSLQGIFSFGSSSSGASSASIPPEEMILDEDNLGKSRKLSDPTSMYFDEPDAFQ